MEKCLGGACLVNVDCNSWWRMAMACQRGCFFLPAATSVVVSRNAELRMCIATPAAMCSTSSAPLPEQCAVSSMVTCFALLVACLLSILLHYTNSTFASPCTAVYQAHHIHSSPETSEPPCKLLSHKKMSLFIWLVEHPSASHFIIVIICFAQIVVFLL